MVDLGELLLRCPLEGAVQVFKCAQSAHSYIPSGTEMFVLSRVGGRQTRDAKTEQCFL